MSEITTKAEELLAGRLESIRRLEEVALQVRSVREQLAAAERSEAQAWSAASGAGWTTAELKQLGFVQPATRRGGRPSRRSAVRTTGNSETGSEG